MDSKVNCESNEAKNNFWKEPGINSIPKLPGKVMKQNSYTSENHNCDQPLNSSNRFNHHSSLIKSSHSSHQHRRNNSTSFESFTASCADAWDSQIDDSLCQDAINRRSSSSAIISKEERVMCYQMLCSNLQANLSEQKKEWQRKESKKCKHHIFSSLIIH